jgi:hypothetical protein
MPDKFPDKKGGINMPKNKKIDIRIEEKLLNDLQVLSWYLGRKRSDFVRYIIESFFEKGQVEIDGRSVPVSEAMLLALEMLNEEHKTLEDLKRNKERNKELPSKLEDDIKRFADYYARQALNAYRKHVKEGGSQ